jgi:hypothetical protein
LRQPFFLQKEFSTAGIEVTKLEREKGQAVIFSKCPSLTHHIPKSPVSGVTRLLSMKGMWHLKQKHHQPEDGGGGEGGDVRE